MTDLCPEHEAANSPAFPYLFHCPSCDAEHVAIGFEKHQIEWIRDLIDESIRFHEYSLKKDMKEGKKDAEEIRWHEGEIKVSEHILRDVIEPGLREFAQIKKVSTAGTMRLRKVILQQTSEEREKDILGADKIWI